MQVDFYILESSVDKDIFTCKIIEKAYFAKHRIFVCCASMSRAEEIDELLWTFKADSFIPHNLEGETYAPPVRIGVSKPSNFNDVLINLTAEVPEFSQKFKRIIEIVAANTKEQSRLNYRHYQRTNAKLNIHKIN